MRRSQILISATIVATPVALSAGSLWAQERGYFPARPTGVSLNKVVGTLLDYGIGNQSGSFTIRESDGRVLEFYVGQAMRIGDKIVRCTVPPIKDFVPDPQLCADWPTNVKLGSTEVRVVYWRSEHEGETVSVSDEINPLP